MNWEEIQKQALKGIPKDEQVEFLSQAYNVFQPSFLDFLANITKTLLMMENENALEKLNKVCNTLSKTYDGERLAIIILALSNNLVQVFAEGGRRVKVEIAEREGGLDGKTETPN